LSLGGWQFVYGLVFIYKEKWKIYVIID